MKKQIYSPYVCLLVSFALVVATSCHRESTSASAASPHTADPVQFIPVTERLVQNQLQLSAKVQADPARSYRIYPPTSGRVLGIQVKQGDRVRKGETVATIQSADAGSAQSDLAKAQIEAERAQRASDREKVLLDHGAVAEKDYIDAKAAAESAQAELARARRHLDVLGLNGQATTDRIPLFAPGSGVVLTVSAAPGELSKSLDNADPLLTIADLSTVWIVGDVFEKDVAEVQPGTRATVTVDAFPGEVWAGRIDSVSGALDPATRTLKVRVALLNRGEKLKPEMFAAIHLEVGQRRSIVVPASTVIHEGQDTVVYVDNNGKPERRKVTVGQTLQGEIEILSGLTPSQRIAVNGAELLTEGDSQP